MVETDVTVNLYRWGIHKIASPSCSLQVEDENEAHGEDKVLTDFEWAADSGDEYVKRFGCKKRQPVLTVTSFSNVGRAPFKRKGATRFLRLIKLPRRMHTGIHANGTVDAIPDDESDDHISQYTAHECD